MVFRSSIYSVVRELVVRYSRDADIVVLQEELDVVTMRVLRHSTIEINDNTWHIETNNNAVRVSKTDLKRERDIPCILYCAVAKVREWEESDKIGAFDNLRFHIVGVRDMFELEERIENKFLSFLAYKPLHKYAIIYGDVIGFDVTERPNPLEEYAVPIITIEYDRRVYTLEQDGGMVQAFKSRRAMTEYLKLNTEPYDITTLIKPDGSIVDYENYVVYRVDRTSPSLDHLGYPIDVYLTYTDEDGEIISSHCNDIPRFNRPF